MSLFDYRRSQEIGADDPPFAALIMAALRKADTHNYERLKLVFPHIEQELRERYHAPSGALPGERGEADFG